MLLGADIGGTKTNLALFEYNQRKLTASQKEKYPSKDYSSLEDIVSDYLKKHSTKLKGAVFGIAGPVQNNEVKATNLPWDVKADSLEKITHCPALLINDLEANAWGISVLQPNELHPLQKVNSPLAGNQALVSAGTGLGQAGLYYDKNKHLPFSSEGGHMDFAPTSQLEVNLWQYLNKKLGHVSYERVLSGQGLTNLFEFLVHENQEKLPSALQKELKSSDPALVVSKHALARSNSTCIKALQLFCELYGAVCGNVALSYKALNGVYLGGGIAPKILPFLESSNFLQKFSDKGRFKDLLKAIPIHVILNDETALLGSGQCALHHFPT